MIEDIELRLCRVCGDFYDIADFEIDDEVCRWCDVILRDELQEEINASLY